MNPPPNGAEQIAGDYVLDSQVGFILRQASQRHTALFASRMGAETTPTQWAALAKLHEIGPTSQNQLGRMTAMDVATIKGVVDRLMKRGLGRSMAIHFAKLGARIFVIGRRPEPLKETCEEIHREGGAAAT